LPESFTVQNGFKQGDVSSPLLPDFTLESVTEKVQKKQKGFQLNGTRQFLVYGDDVNLLWKTEMQQRKT
jgi:hypothetical protein